MRKKILVLFFSVLSLAVVIVKVSSPNKTNKVFYLVNNENELFSKKSIVAYNPNYLGGIPFSDENIENIKKIKEIESIVPYNPLIIDPNYSKNCSKVVITQDADKTEINLPLNDSNEKILNYIGVQCYLSQDNFEELNNIKLRFKADNGIYISEHLFECLNLKKNKNSEVTLEAVVLYPKTAKVENEQIFYVSFAGEDVLLDLEEYLPKDYYEKKVTFEIAGVISKNHHNVTSDNIIAIPYEVSEKIKSDMNVESGIPNQWYPNMYMISCKSDVQFEQLGQKLLTVIPNFQLYEKNSSIDIFLNNKKIFKVTEE